MPTPFLLQYDNLIYILFVKYLQKSIQYIYIKSFLLQYDNLIYILFVKYLQKSIQYIYIKSSLPG